jgi:hypothetical protein
MDELRTLNKTNLKNMAIDKGLSRKGFNGRNISRMRKQDFIDFLLDRQTTRRLPFTINRRSLDPRPDHTGEGEEIDHDFEEEIFDFFEEIIMNGYFQPIVHVLGLDVLRLNNVSSSASEGGRVPKEEDECVPCLSLKDGSDDVLEENSKIRSNIQEMENKITCVICQSNERKILFSPCNHLATCITCSKNSLLKNCPLCRKEFDKLTRVFY